MDDWVRGFGGDHQTQALTIRRMGICFCGMKVYRYLGLYFLEVEVTWLSIHDFIQWILNVDEGSRFNLPCRCYIPYTLIQFKHLQEHPIKELTILQTNHITWNYSFESDF